MSNESNDLSNEQDEVWTPISARELEMQRMHRLITAKRAPSAQASRQDLKDHIVELAQAYFDSDAPAAVGMAELNRRFGRSARALGTSARELVLELMQEGRVGVSTYRTSTVIYDAEALKSYLKPYFSLEKPEIQSDMQNLIFSRALKGAD